MLLILMLAALAIAAEGEADSTAPSAWKVVATDGAVIIMHVQPDRARDKAVYAEAVTWVFDRLGDQGSFQIDFFDDEAHTPVTRRYTDDNRACQVARFNFNPRNGMKRFLWIEPVDPAKPKGKRQATEDTLPPPAGKATHTEPRRGQQDE